MSKTEEYIFGWKHFCDCIDFGRSGLDAEAIRFMNESPGTIIEALTLLDETNAAKEKS